MQRTLGALCGLASLLLVATTSAQADVKLKNGQVLSAKPYFIVTYIEVAPDEADKAAKLLAAHRDASKVEKGNQRFEVVRRNGRDNHFVVLEAWDDQAARDAHAESKATGEFRKALHPLLYSPYDERPHVGLVAAAPAKLPAGKSDTVYVITHVDIIPPEQFAPCKRQISEKGPCGNAMVEKLANDSRKHKGNVRFDVLTQNNRPNHMTVVEMWNNADARNAHLVNAETKAFRDELHAIKPGSGVDSDPLFVPNPLTGSLYDERLYTLVE